MKEVEKSLWKVSPWIQNTHKNDSEKMGERIEKGSKERK